MMNINDKVILVTGGTGSFGKYFTKYILDSYHPKKIVVFSRDEYKQYVMRQEFDKYGDRVRFLVGDVRDKERLSRALDKVDIVVHAAALKHVPILEYNPIEAVKTNILGAVNVIDAALDRQVKCVVALSTDKAVNPVNLYGGTKLVSDKLFVSANAYVGANKIRFTVVRYGNVAGSRGSVIPFFQSIDAKKKSYPVTDRRMTRFWLSLNQAVHLVIEAINSSRGGEIYVAKCPSFKIIDLVKSINPQAKIEEVGVRPGEKLHEVMITEEDAARTYEYKNHYIIYPPQLKFGWWTKKRLHVENAKKVQSDFRYASNTNDLWLDTKQMIRMINEFKKND